MPLAGTTFRVRISSTDGKAARASGGTASQSRSSRRHHPDITFGWGYASVSLRTKKIKGLHENDFIMAAKLDRIASGTGAAGQQS
jgi:pterin-4a-carbinolamine dehydratase